MMRVAIRVLAAVVGVALLGLVVNVNVAAKGGYDTPVAQLMIGLAAGVAAGSLAIGLAWEERRRGITICLVVALLAGEAWALLQTAERTITHREQQQTPLRAAADARTQAAKRVTAAEAALGAIGETPRLAKALAAKAAADAAVIAKSDKRGCASNCRQLLQAQVDAAAAEVADARAEVERMRTDAENHLQQARADFAALPSPPSTTPLADRLGIQGWRLDLLHAGLASLAANGLAAMLLAFAAHGWGRRPAGTDVARAPAAAPATAEAQPTRDPTDEADRFARATFRPAQTGRVKLAEIPAAYRAWCHSQGLEPLPELEIGSALSALFSSVGLYRRGNGTNAVIVGMEWRAGGPPLLAKPESAEA